MSASATIARFATRHLDGQPGATDLILGVMMKSQGAALRPDYVYEIRSILDELVLVPIGPSANPRAWDHDVSEILTRHKEDVFCTTAEVAASRKPAAPTD